MPPFKLWVIPSATAVLCVIIPLLLKTSSSVYSQLRSSFSFTLCSLQFLKVNWANSELPLCLSDSIWSSKHCSIALASEGCTSTEGILNWCWCILQSTEQNSCSSGNKQMNKQNEKEERNLPPLLGKDPSIFFFLLYPQSICTILCDNHQKITEWPWLIPLYTEQT